MWIITYWLWHFLETRYQNGLGIGRRWHLFKLTGCFLANVVTWYFPKIINEHPVLLKIPRNTVNFPIKWRSKQQKWVPWQFDSYDVMIYDVMKYDIIKYDFMKYDMTSLNVMSWNMTSCNMTSWIKPVIGPNLECYILKEVIEVDEVNESKNICCTREAIQILKGWDELCHTHLYI